MLIIKNEDTRILGFKICLKNCLLLILVVIFLIFGVSIIGYSHQVIKQRIQVTNFVDDFIVLSKAALTYSAVVISKNNFMCFGADKLSPLIHTQYICYNFYIAYCTTQV